MSPRYIVERGSPRSKTVAHFAYFFGGLALAIVLLLLL
jgi:hypothetical protein